MTTTIIEAVKAYLAYYSGLKANSPLWVNFLGVNPTEYNIVPLPGARIAERYLSGGSTREFPFAFQSVESTAEELDRLQSAGFYEALADWFETQTEEGIFTNLTLNAGQTPEKIEALGSGFLFQQGESQTGIYQIQCKLTYSQAA